MHVSFRIGMEKKEFSLRIWIASQLLRLAEWILNTRTEENEGGL